MLKLRSLCRTIEVIHLEIERVGARHDPLEEWTEAKKWLHHNLDNKYVELFSELARALMAGKDLDAQKQIEAMTKLIEYHTIQLGDDTDGQE